MSNTKRQHGERAHCVKEAALIGIADFIRSRSSAGELVASADLEAQFACPAPARALEPDLVEDMLSSHDDIKVVPDDAGNRFYYSELFMTGAYASVLMLKNEGPLRMMAEVIREHSRVYPRPVPVALFQCSPFNLDEERIALALEEMIQEASYRDIAHITTSIGNVFAYSTDYLDRDYAAMLAEWVDVGQVENP